MVIPTSAVSHGRARLLRIVRLASAVIIVAAALIACEKKPAIEVETSVEPTPVIDKERVNTAADQLWTAGTNTFSTSVGAASELNAAIDAFLTSPSTETLKTAQQKWQDAFLAYRRFYFFHFLGQAAPSSFNTLAELHFRIAAHPIQPGYLDSFGPYLYSGMVHDIGMEITRENLIGQHGLTDPEDAALGLYAIHFMLFGIDARRQVEDYAPVKQLSREEIESGFKSVKETPNHRRRLLLQLQADILLDDLTTLQNTWQSSEPDSAYLNWQALAPREKLNTVRQTLKQGLTQLIVDVVEIKKLQEAAMVEPEENAQAGTETGTNETEEPAAAENEFHYSSYPAADQQQFVLLSIESLMDAVPVLRKEKREQVESLLSETSALLSEPFSEKQDSWTSVYENLKSAIDTINAK